MTANFLSNPLTDSKTIEAIKKAIGGDRKAFPTIQEAFTAAESLAPIIDETGLPFEIVGTGENGELDESVYADSLAVLATLGGRTEIESDGKKKNVIGIKAIVIYPQPTVESFLSAGDDGVSFIESIVEKECALIAFRRFRDSASAAEFASNVQSVPLTPEAFVTSQRSGGGIDTDAFDELWPAFRKHMRKADVNLWKALPSKGAMQNALRSKSYAESDPETIPFEERGFIEKIGQMLIAAGENMQNEKGEPDPVDCTTIQAWLDSRDELALEYRAPTEKDYGALSAFENMGL